jgi:hypothetical protein
MTAAVLSSFWRVSCTSSQRTHVSVCATSDDDMTFKQRFSFSGQTMRTVCRFGDYTFDNVRCQSTIGGALSIGSRSRSERR